MAKVVVQDTGKVLVKSAPSTATAGQVAQALALANQAILAANGEHHLSQSTGVSINSTTTMQDKINATTASLSAGTYKITTSFSYNMDSVTQDWVGDCLIDGASLETSAFDFARFECKDRAGNTESTGSNQAYAFTRVDYATFGTAATHTIQLQWRSDDAGTNASIWSASVLLEKLS